MHKDDCIFCNIALGTSPSHIVWEDEHYLAFLSIFPNTEGVTVVIPKEHYGSYVFDLPEELYTGLLQATRTVAKLLDASFEDVGRTGLIAEGYGVDHAHTKLFPMHGTAFSDWKPIEAAQPKYFDQYEGYLSSHDYERADDESLSQLAQKIKKIHQN
jgi:histidine triad (HIT) family protein